MPDLLIDCGATGRTCESRLFVRGQRVREQEVVPTGSDCEQDEYGRYEGGQCMDGKNNTSLIHASPFNALKSEQTLVDRFADPSIDFLTSYWITSQCLVAPKALRRAKNFERSCLQSALCGWPVYIRNTGGDLTPQGKGILNVAIAYAMDSKEQPSIPGVFSTLCDPIKSMLADFGAVATTSSVPGSFCDGAYNVVVDGRKIAGTAQRWTRVRGTYARKVVFAHAIILVDVNVDRGIDAINRIYRSCAIDQLIEKNVYIDVSTLSPDNRKKIGCQQVAMRLDKYYQKTLSALTA